MESEKLAWTKAQQKLKIAESAEIAAAVNEPDFVNASLEYHRAEQTLLTAEQAYQEAHEAHHMAVERLNEAHRAAMADIKAHDAWARIQSNKTKDAPAIALDPVHEADALQNE